MAAYRKKPVVIEATQFKVADPSTHAHVNFGYPREENPAPGSGSASWLDGKHWIATLEGPHIVNEGDWIITGVKGEHYPCKPDIFEMTYEPA
jgi:hypothetical protein